MKILEIGVGYGGSHLEKRGDLPNYYVCDEKWGILAATQLRYPWVQAVPGAIEDLNLPDDFFDQIEIRFPFGSLLVPGLQKRVIGVPPQLEYVVQVYCPDDTESPQLYPKFAQILRPAGRLLIWGDQFVDTEAIRELSSPYFEATSVTPISLDELRQMATKSSLCELSTLEIALGNGSKLSTLTTLTKI